MKALNYTEVKRQYRKLLEFGLIVSLLFCVMLFQGSKRLTVTSKVKDMSLGRQIEQVDAVRTEQENKKPVVKLPVIPIPGVETDILDPDDIWIQNPNPLPSAPPPMPPGPPEEVVFIIVEHQAEPIGGYGAIVKQLKYPEMARLAGIEGRVVIFAKIDEDGNVVKTIVHQSVGFEPCDVNAMNAVKSVKWKPALQRDQPVSVWVSVPIDFKLR